MMRPVLAVLLALASPAAADRPGGHIAPVASRLFLIGEAPASQPGLLFIRPEDLELTGVPWIGALIADDAELQGAQAVLAATEARADQILSPKGLPSQHGELAGLPASLNRPGLLAETGPDQPGADHILYRAAQGLRDLMVRCRVIGPDQGICELNATYAADAHILPTAVWAGPLPRDLAQVRAMADRMREIAGCLDVTGRVPADPAARLAELRATNPRLEDCTEALVS